MASFIPLPGNVTYAATKSYLNFFTGGLNVDLAGSGVRVQALCPGFTYSEFHDVANVRQKMVPGFMWMNAEPVVEASLRGLREGREIVIPGLVNRLEYLALRFLPVGPIARLVKAWWM